MWANTLKSAYVAEGIPQPDDAAPESTHDEVVSPEALCQPAKFTCLPPGNPNAFRFVALNQLLAPACKLLTNMLQSFPLR